MRLKDLTKSSLAHLHPKRNLVKIILLVSILIFAISLFLFKFEILTPLNQAESARLALIQSSGLEFLKAPSDVIQGAMQWVGLKLLPNHHIFAMRAPTALLIFVSICMISVGLYLKFRNRYLPYLFAVFAASSPWLILLSHQGFLPGIDTFLLLSIIFCSYSLITKSDLSLKWKGRLNVPVLLALGALAWQPFGLIIMPVTSFFAFRNGAFRSNLQLANKKIKTLSIIGIIVSFAVGLGLIAINPSSWQALSGYTLIKSPSTAVDAFTWLTESIFGVPNQKGLKLGTGRPDFLLIAAVSLTVYEVFKKRVGRLELAVALLGGLALGALYHDPTSILFAVPFAIAILALAIANMAQIIDLAFPRNPYPKNIAKTGLVILICSLASLNIYTLVVGTSRENSPPKVDQMRLNIKD